MSKQSRALSLSSRWIVFSAAAAMSMPTGFLSALVLDVATAILATTSPSLAVPITYTEQATASGSLDGVAFNNANVVIRMTSDTTTVHYSSTLPDGTPAPDSSPGNFGPATVSVAGGPPIALSNEAFVTFFAGNLVGFQFVLMTDLRGLPFLTYDLKTSIVLSGPSFVCGGCIGPLETTTGGTFSLNSGTGNSTFTATATGDPHFTTYGGGHYDYQGVGDFLLARSTVDQFDVQVRTRLWSDRPAATIMSEAVATVCNHNLNFDIDRAGAGGSFVWIDGSPSSLSVASPVLTLGTCKIDELSPEHYQVVWNTGEMLDVTNDGTYLDLSSQLSWIDGLGSMEGLLSSALNPDAWRVTGAASLFDPVPEPGTLTLLASALAGLGIIRRRATSPKPR
jgi:hypothetical protein